jgi:pimeloyl-ACP methyl ester carboxylesterase
LTGENFKKCSILIRRIVMTNNNIVERFCTPPPMSETDYDRKAVAGAKIVKIPFEGYRLTGYVWGSGKAVLLAHGWGSRASHFAPLGRALARAGFQVLAFDGPSHGRSLKDGQKQRSSMFEFCRAIATVASTIQPLYAIVGHSLGAAAAAFTVSGHASLSSYKTFTERLVLISTPASVARMIENFCRRENLEEKVGELTHGLEREFRFSASNYLLPPALSNVEASILLVHDEHDKEIPLADAISLKDAHKDARLVVTQGAGHQKILANRVMIRAVKNFLTEPEKISA